MKNLHKVLWRKFVAAVTLSAPLSQAISAELAAVNILLSQDDHLPLMKLLQKGIPFVRTGPRDYESFGGQIHVCNDICGYEVSIGGRRGWIDTSYHEYGLTRMEGKELFHAVVSNVPGSALYEERILNRRKGDTHEHTEMSTLR